MPSRMDTKDTEEIDWGFLVPFVSFVVQDLGLPSDLAPYA